MRQWRRLIQCGGLVAALAFAGCRTAPKQPEYAEIPDLPGTPIGVPAAAGGTDSASASAPAVPAPAPVAPVSSAPAVPFIPVSSSPAASVPDVQPVAAAPARITPAEEPRSQDMIKPGEILDITYSDVREGLPPAHEKVREDGTITLMYNKSFVAAGKTPGELQAEIRNAYVPDYFKQLTVSISRPEIRRVIFIDGEVRAPSKQEYSGRITLTQVIASAGGFTDFANKRNIEVIRANGKKESYSYPKILKNPQLDPEINPNDRILIHRSIF